MVPIVGKVLHRGVWAALLAAICVLSDHPLRSYIHASAACNIRTIMTAAVTRGFMGHRPSCNRSGGEMRVRDILYDIRVRVVGARAAGAGA
jgi:hypothetical protein